MKFMLLRQTQIIVLNLILLFTAVAETLETTDDVGAPPAAASFVSQHDYRYRQTSSAHDDNIPESEIDALQALFMATNGSSWRWLNESHGIPWVFTASANPCADNWQGIDCSHEPRVISIALTTQRLQGTLPMELGNFTKLTSLRISHNLKLRGSLPASLGLLTELRFFEISRNSLTGTMPTSLANLGSLRNILLFENKLQGTIPTFMCNMTQLNGIDLSINKFQGSIPACLCGLSNLTAGLALARNHLTGTIPSCFSNLTRMRGLDISQNRLSGTIPSALGGMTKLRFLAAYNNTLSGPLPASLGNLLRLKGLYVYTNALTGTIPLLYAQLIELDYFDINTNQISGPFPQYVPTMIHMKEFGIYRNKISGPIPAEIGQLKKLNYFQAYECRLSGPLPASLGNLANLLYLQLYSNSISGPIPASIGNMTQLQSFQVSDNHITGAIPEGMGKLGRLQLLWLDDNHLKGSIPRSVSAIPMLQELFLSNNQLSGTLENFFDPFTQTLLDTIQMSGNQLTGSLPQTLFALPMLSTFAAVSNCFVTSLTEHVCACTSLVTLALDGLQSSSKCQQKIFPGLSDSYLVAQPMKGGIPACIFSMPNLSTLHLSGNGISGSLSSDLVVSPSLIDLSLSHNSLTGSIPVQVQDRQWFNLDLAYNRFSGSLSPHFAAQALNYSRYIQFADTRNPSSRVAVTIENNRLSGKIPGTIHSLLNVSVLGSNMFSCDPTGSDLPTHDGNTDKYSCGSDSFNTPYFVWMALVFCISAACLARIRCSKTGWRSQIDVISKWLAVVDGGAEKEQAHMVAKLQSLPPVMFVFNATCTLTSVVLAFALLVLLPFYVASTYRFGTFKHMYAWTVSAAFLSGEVPTGLEMGLLLLLMALLIGVAHRLSAQYQQETKVAAGWSWLSLTSRSWAERYSLRRRVAAYALFMSSSFVVVFGVNLTYVYMALYHDNRTLLLSQILLSFFKLFWNKFCATYLMRWTASVVFRDADDSEIARGKDLMFVLLLVTLVNNIGIPCLVVAVVSPNCFYNLFVPAPTVDATYTYYFCSVINDFNGECFIKAPTIGSTTYDPPFSYSYQCSGSFITYYAPAFVFLCITATILTPLSEALALWLHRRGPPRFKCWEKLLMKFIPRILRPLDIQAAHSARNVFHPYFDANRRIVTLFSYLGILVTFGAVFPPLGVAVAVTVYASALMEKLKLGRFLTLAHEQGAAAYAEVIEAECRGAGGVEVFRMAVRMVAAFGCCFYTLFLYDALGDAQGFRRAYWVLIAMPGLPVACYTALNLHARLAQKLVEGGKPVEVELQNTDSPMLMHSGARSVKEAVVDAPNGV